MGTGLRRRRPNVQRRLAEIFGAKRWWEQTGWREAFHVWRQSETEPKRISDLKSIRRPAKANRAMGEPMGEPLFFHGWRNRKFEQEETEVTEGTFHQGTGGRFFTEGNQVNEESVSRKRHK